ncbi:uncharacterized protein MELLADRAFT_103654 [Melampsora larici-populina 98AG31]|uniref:Uncharacterized protein n=1 Tax=Melampsora larici-populina (strain 98AG31 / pathotype 3-4-7) TaxID=747676 RepID=F4RC14_MELLP|nr:uncharacterized protein MELLADRAFT_103654 [Melampsora larici-populina 98AG31]EGG10200.1 hypothetical protein MELLADRAFT_103654 [Melampsora larici-populina 98AG31]
MPLSGLKSGKTKQLPSKDAKHTQCNSTQSTSTILICSTDVMMACQMVVATTDTEITKITMMLKMMNIATIPWLTRESIQELEETCGQEVGDNEMSYEEEVGERYEEEEEEAKLERNKERNKEEEAEEEEEEEAEEEEDEENK